MQVLVALVVVVFGIITNKITGMPIATRHLLQYQLTRDGRDGRFVQQVDMEKVRTKCHRRIEKAGDRTTQKIAVLVPTTSRGAGPNSVSKQSGVEAAVNGLLYFKVLVPTFLWSIDPSIPVDYIFYFGYDDDDTFFSAAIIDQIATQFAVTTGECPVVHKAIKLDGRETKHRPVQAWNVLADKAIQDGADYLFQVNDDLEFLTKNWTALCIDKLKTFAIPNVGVVGPLDEGNPRILTQCFVHKTHYEIFGSLYPKVFRNWWSDDWISNIYAESTAKLENFRVWNSNLVGTRYEIDWTAQHKLQEELNSGKQKINQYIASHKPH